MREAAQFRNSAAEAFGGRGDEVLLTEVLPFAALIATHDGRPAVLGAARAFAGGRAGESFTADSDDVVVEAAVGDEKAAIEDKKAAIEDEKQAIASENAIEVGDEDQLVQL